MLDSLDKETISTLRKRLAKRLSYKKYPPLKGCGDKPQLFFVFIMNMG